MEQSEQKLSLKVRVLVGIIALPSLILAFFLLWSVANGDVASIGAFELVYSAVGVFAIYMAITGKRFF